MKWQHGQTVEYDRMMAEQNGLCAICKQPETRKSRWGKVAALCVDHNHGTGAIRRLLCHACNTGLGKFKDSPNLLQAAINYLNTYTYAGSNTNTAAGNRT